MAMKDTTDICDRKTYASSACVRKEIPRQRFLDPTCSKVIRLRRRTPSNGKLVRTYWLILFLICFAVAFIASGCKKKEGRESSVKTVEVALPLVDSVTIYNEYPATIVTESQADVVAKVNGQILSRNFQPGSYVKKGQLLYVIESKTYSAAVGEANALIVSASPSGEDGAPVYRAALDYEAPNVESSSGSVTLTARLKSPGKYLRSGMYGKIKLPVSTSPKGILVRDASRGRS